MAALKNFNLMKYTIGIILYLISWSGFGQLPTFNRIHPINFQSPPYDYLASGTFHDVFEINEIGVNQDGYLLFGRGNLLNPLQTSLYARVYSVKINIDGDMMWSNRFDQPLDSVSSYFSAANDLTFFINHNNIITGPMVEKRMIGNNFSTYRNLAQFDNQGQLIQRVLIDSTLNDIRYYRSIEDFRDSTYVIVGGYIASSDVENNVQPDAYITKVDTTGNTIWSNTFANTYCAYQVIAASSFGYWVFLNEILGSCNGGFDTDVKIIRLGSDGAELARWEENFYCGGEGLTLVEQTNGDLLIVGKANLDEQSDLSPGAGYFYSTILQYQNTEIVEIADREVYHYDSVDSHLNDLNKLSDNSGYISAGWIWDVEWAQYLGYLMKIDNDRQLVWKRTYNYFPLVENVFNGWNYLYQVSETSDGGFIGVGQIREHAVHPNPQLYVPWVFKTDEYGCLEPGCQFVGTEDILVGLDNTMTVFPNPVGDIATISFGENLSQISELLSNGELVIFDINGKEIYRTNTRSVTTEGQLQINTQSWSSGIYLAQLISGSKWLDGVRIVRE